MKTDIKGAISILYALILEQELRITKLEAQIKIHKEAIAHLAIEVVIK